jgi:hypothetical protein
LLDPNALVGYDRLCTIDKYLQNSEQLTYQKYNITSKDGVTLARLLMEPIVIEVSWMDAEA